MVRCRCTAEGRRTDRRNEALDCTVYALYLSRALQLHLRKPHSWDIIEMQLRQGVLVPADTAPAPQLSDHPQISDHPLPLPNNPAEERAKAAAAHRAEMARFAFPKPESAPEPEPALALAEPPASAPADQRATAAAAAFNAMLKARRTRHGRH